MPPQPARDVFSALTPARINGSVHSAAETTPSQRKAVQMSDGARKHVQTAAEHLDGGRCIIERVHEDSAVQYAHVLARATSDETIDCLEYSWGMRYGTLNLDTRENIFKLNAALHILFDRGEWMLLPEEHIIQRYYVAAQANLPMENHVMPETRRVAFPQIDDKQYKYKILAHIAMCRVPIHRQTSSLSATHQISANDFTFLDFPFRDFTVTSHVHPRFIICNAGRKLAESSTIHVQALRLRYPQSMHLIDMVLLIYTAWTEQVRDTEAMSNFKDSEDPGPGDGMSQSSRQTKKRRVGNRKQPLPKEWASPTQQVGQEQRGGHQDTVWKLDGATLCEMDVMKGSDYVGHGEGSKGMSIMEWADRVAELTKVDGGASQPIPVECPTGVV